MKRYRKYMRFCERYNLVIRGKRNPKLSEPFPYIDYMNEFFFQTSAVFHNVINEDTNWGHFMICEGLPIAYYAYWLLINLYTTILFQPHLIHRSRKQAKGRWFDKLFAPIFEDPLTLKLTNGFQLSQGTIVIVQLKNI